ncbi:30S ribosomal protein S8 [Streptomyces sp. DJ]|nr:30S ribosomal protein S8 [Streptomyces sp. DJ]
MVSRVGVSQTREHVCDRVGHGHDGLRASLAGVSGATSLSPSRVGAGAKRGPTA